ncbi:hypothetical protein [Oceanobacillus sp. FSL W7-1293]|uniref:hypothetical protein n=1 Tax=Oceanobacillus sp. FSL W7-1293 TaxID=2921699 RepID=UPI0030CC0F3F
MVIKKTFLLLLAFISVLIMSACSETHSDEEGASSDQTNEEMSSDKSLEAENEQEESLLPEDFGENAREDARENAASDYLKASIEYIDADFGQELLVDKIDNAEKVNTGEKEGQNKIDVEITLNEKFADSAKGLALPHLILIDLVNNKFNEFAKSNVNEVHFVINAPVEEEVMKVYEAVIDEEGYNKIQDERISQSLDMNVIVENAKEFWLHDIYEEDIFNGIDVRSIENEDE